MSRNSQSSLRRLSKQRVSPIDKEKTEKDIQIIALNDLENGSYIAQDTVKKETKVSEKNIDENVDDNDFDDDDDSDDEEELSESTNFLAKFLILSRKFIFDLWKKPYTTKILLAVLFIGFVVYLGFSMKLNNPFYFPSYANSTSLLDDYVFSNNRGLALFILVIIVGFFFIWDNYLAALLQEKLTLPKMFKSNFLNKWGKWIIISLVLIGCIIYLILDIDNPYNLVSISGIAVFIFFCISISAHPANINWRVLAVGLEIQFILGVILMRTDFGYKLFKFLSGQVTAFLEYTDKGSQLVFGDKYKDHIFAFQSIPVIVFFSAVINLLYYIGFIQYLILKLSWFVNLLMGTSPTESMNATANIFLGQTEAPLLIKPFLSKMTRSEIFSVMTGGFATVSGSVLAAYINFKIPANHLIIASLMAAPGSLLVSKTIYPETKKTKANWDAIKNLPKGDANNIFEAISIGASNMVGPIGGILSNLIAFTAFFAFIDAIFIWLFSMLGLSNFGVTGIMQYLFYPFAFLMGVKIEDCQNVSKLIGIKVFVNEFVAYSELGKTINFRQAAIQNGTFDAYLNGTIPLPSDLYMIWDDRSVLISTYALCGFANFASIGIQIGGLSALAPKRFKTFTKFAAKAMIAGNITNFITACIAGLLFQKL